MKISILQNIFCPNEHMLQKNIDSILSQYQFKGKVEFHYIGWCKEEFWEQIEKVIKPLNPKTFIKRRKNYGKAYNINQLVHNINTDFILTMDSDIIFKDNVDYFSELKNLINIPKLGIISLNQEEHNCHLLQIMDHKMIHKQHEIVWSSSGGGIAGGCILVNKEAWDKVEGYRVMGVYAGDDAHLFKDIKNKGYLNGLDKSLSVIHPHDNNRQYQLWKLHVCTRDSNGNTDINLDDKIKESMKIWGV